MNPYRQPKVEPPTDHPCLTDGCNEVLGAEQWFCSRCWDCVRSQTQQELNVAFGMVRGVRDFKHPRYQKALHAARIEAGGAMAKRLDRERILES